jgi:copper chaperone CopZ
MKEIMAQSILVVENDDTTVSALNAIGSVYGVPIHIESDFAAAKSYFENNDCIIALQEVIINNKTSVSLFDIARDSGSKNFETPVAIMNAEVSAALNKKLRKKVFGIVNKPFDQTQLEKTLQILVSSSQIIKMGKALAQMKFTEQIMAVEGITEVVVKLSTIATGWLKEDKPYDSKAANAGINEFIMIIQMEDELKPESQKLVEDLESSVRSLYALLEQGSIEPLSSWMIEGVFTFYTGEDLVVAGQEAEVEEEESQELTPEQIDAMMNGGGAAAPAAEPEPEGNLTQEQIEALLNGE